MSRRNIPREETPEKQRTRIRIPELKLHFKILLYLATVICAVLSMLAIQGIFPYIVELMIYTFAGVTLSAACYYLVKDVICLKNGMKEKVRPVIEGNSFANRMATDYRYRTVLFAVPGLLLNIIYAAFHGVVAIFTHSAWLGTLSAYYIILSVMRFSVIWYDRKVSDMEQTKEVMLKEVSVYRRCGIFFVIMTVALIGAVILMVKSEGGKSYPGYLIFVVAAYTFCKIIISVIHVIKVRRLKSPILITIRNISYVDACVSILTLQTAMFASFGGGAVEFEQQMNAITGGIVCLMVLTLGIGSMVSSSKMKKRIMEGGIGSD